MPEAPSRGWPRWAWIVGALCVAGGVAGGVLAGTVGASVGYHTALATVTSVRSYLTVPGTVDPVQQSKAAFGASGTVASVDVSLGQTVEAGQALATLDPTTLQRNVTLAESKLHAAQATLTGDESAQSDATDPSTSAADPSASTDGGSSGASTPAATGSTGTATSTSAGTLHAAQQAVVTSQKTVDADEQTATSDLTRARSICKGSGGQSGTPASTGAGTPGASTGAATHTATTKSIGPSSPTATSKATGTTSTPGGTGAGTAPSSSQATCTAALTTALAAQGQVATAERAVTRAETQLARILVAETRSSEGGHSTSGTTSSSGATRRSTSTATDSAAQLATDQATIDTDEASLIEAQESLAAATLRSPISGTVAAIDLTVGEAVAAGSASDAITVIDHGTFEAVGSLTSSQVPAVKVGDTVDVVVDGVTRPLHGTVTRVGPVDVSSSSYPLVVALRPSAASLFDGSTAQINVVVRQAHNVLAVPTSSVHTDAIGHSYVMTLVDGQERRTSVAVGVVGAIYTQVTSGLRRGATVVLADMAEPVPTSSSTTSRFAAFNALNGGSGVVRFNPGAFKGAPHSSRVSVTAAP